MQFNNANATRNADGSRPKAIKSTIPTIKLDESYNTDKGPETLASKDDFGDYKNRNQDIPSESTAVYTRVSNIYIL